MTNSCVFRGFRIGMEIVVLYIMKKDGFLFLRINEFSNITFPFFNAALDENRGFLNLSVTRNEFTKAFQKNRRCRVEFGFEKAVDAEIRSVEHSNGEMVLSCVLVKGGFDG